MTYIALTIILIGGSVYLASYAGIEHRYLRYRSFQLRVINPLEHPLVTEEELKDTLLALFGDFEGKDLNSVPLFDIEQFLNTNPYVFKTNVYSTLNGEISVSVLTRIPMLRVINIYSESAIIDTSGVMMPVSQDHPVRLTVATGNIEEHFLQGIARNLNVRSLQQGAMLRELFEITCSISKDKFLDALIGQIYVNSDQEIELIPKIGEQVILFGSSEDICKKLEKLKAFYLEVMKHEGWDVYKKINLTFENQVVCSK